MSRSLSKLILIAICLVTAVSAASQNSKKVRQMKAERNELKKQIDSNEQLLRSTRKDVKSQLDNLALLDAQINTHQTYMQGIQNEADSLDREMQQLQADIHRLQQELSVCKANYRRAMTYVSRSRLQQSRWSFILAAKDFRTMYRRMRYATEFSKNQKARGIVIARKEEDLKARQARLQLARQEKEDLLAEGRKAQAQLDSKKKERQTMVDNLNRQQTKLQTGIREQRKKYEALNKKIDRTIQEEIAAAERRRKAEEARKRKEAEQRRREEERRRKEAESKKNNHAGSHKAGKKRTASDAPSSTATPKFHEPEGEDRKLSSNFAANRGNLPAPISGAFAVTSRFGKYEVQGLGGVTLDNKGVNLTGKSGAQARSIFHGEVSAVVGMGGGTYVVIVRHGEYYSVYSNLASVNVARGQKVTTNQTLGRIADDSSGNATLHFQLRHHTEKLNPLSWIRH